ncbi:hypothetical protein AB0M68_43155, partial [Streptomyces sp. NPDC051453]|uniref:GlgB N-terminal domain-containing protein n=1 Tax=Streptomyces sp. NPDC051453 TaxID=3154941 RepID=UPI00341A863B
MAARKPSAPKTAKPGKLGPGRLTVPPAPAMDESDRGRLLWGQHHDPHSLLGVHPVDGGVAFRVLRPYAQAVAVSVE